MLVGIDRAFGRDQFENFDGLGDVPAMGARAIAQLLVGFGQTDVDARLSDLFTGQQKLQRDRGLSGSRASLQEMKSIASEPAA